VLPAPTLRLADHSSRTGCYFSANGSSINAETPRYKLLVDPPGCLKVERSLLFCGPARVRATAWSDRESAVLAQMDKSPRGRARLHRSNSFGGTNFANVQKVGAESVHSIPGGEDFIEEGPSPSAIALVHPAFQGLNLRNSPSARASESACF
jgi:hypothetical protein